MPNLKSIVSQVIIASSSKMQFEELQGLIRLADVLKNSIEMNDDFLVVTASDPASFTFCEFLKSLEQKEVEILYNFGNDMVVTENFIEVIKKYLTWE